MDIKYSGKRSLSKIIWKLSDSDAEDKIKDSIHKILDDANNNNADTVTFRSLLF